MGLTTLTTLEKCAAMLNNFASSISSTDKVCILHHTDPDGVCSGVIAAKIVEAISGKNISAHMHMPAGVISADSEIIARLKSMGTTKLVVTDLGIDQSPQAVKIIERFAEIIVIDHHKIYNDISSEKTRVVKPQLFSEIPPGSYPASKLCFDLGRGASCIESLDWIAAVGLIGDCSFIQWKSFVDSVLEKHGMEKMKDVFDTVLGRIASIISNAESYDSAQASEAFSILYSAKSPFDALNSRLKDYNEIVGAEIARLAGRMESDAEKKNGIILFRINSKYRVRGPLSTKLSLMNPSSTIILVQDNGDGTIGISGRRRDGKVAVNDLLEKAVAGINGASAGGHAPAAGGAVPSKSFDEFRKRLFSTGCGGRAE